MQDRFCRCGHRVVVAYVAATRAWRSLFFSKGDMGRCAIRRCPKCGRRLDIDALR